MKFAITLLAALLACGQAMAADCAIKVVASLDMAHSSGDDTTVPVTVNGSAQNFWLLLDHAFSGIRTSTSRELGMRSKDLPQMVDIGGRQVTSAVIATDFQIGMVHAPNFSMLQLPESVFEEKAVSGILGLDILAHYELELDMKNNKLNLISQDHCPGEVVYWTQQPYAKVPFERDNIGHILIQVELDGKPVRGNISIDESRSKTFMSVARSMYGLDRESPGMSLEKAKTADHPTQYDYTFKTLSIGGIMFTNPAIRIEDSEQPKCDGKSLHGAKNYGLKPDEDDHPKAIGVGLSRCFGGTDIVLGLPELRRLHMLISFKENMLYITPAGAGE